MSSHSIVIPKQSWMYDLLHAYDQLKQVFYFLAAKITIYPKTGIELSVQFPLSMLVFGLSWVYIGFGLFNGTYCYPT